MRKVQAEVSGAQDPYKNVGDSCALLSLRQLLRGALWHLSSLIDSRDWRGQNCRLPQVGFPCGLHRNSFADLLRLCATPPA